MKRPELVHGEWFVVCDRTGFRVLSSQIRRQWDNSLVYERVYETRQPQDLLKGRPDNMTVPFARPKLQPTFVTTNQVQPSDL